MVETLWAEIGRSRRFSKGVGHFERRFQREGGVADQPLLVSSSRVIALSCGIKISAVRHLVLSQCTHVTDRQTDRIMTPKTTLTYARVVKMFLCETSGVVLTALVNWAGWSSSMHYTPDSDSNDEVLPTPCASLQCPELGTPPQSTDESLVEIVAAYKHPTGQQITAAILATTE